MFDNFNDRQLTPVRSHPDYRIFKKSGLLDSRTYYMRDLSDFPKGQGHFIVAEWHARIEIHA